MGRGWQALGLFWLAVLLAAGGGAAVLEQLGPLPHPAVAPAVRPPRDAGPPAPVPAPVAGRIASPDPALLEPSKGFPPAMLPRIAADGRLAHMVYARPFNPADTRPRVGLILAGVGVSEADSRAAIDTTPGAVTLAFSPYAANADLLMDAARAKGHEMLASIPMESQGYPSADAGSRSLMTGADPAANRRNLEWALSRGQGYVGATGASDGLRGERFAELVGGMASVLDEVGRRGLLYVDPRPGKSAPTGFRNRTVDIVVDDPPARAEIEGKLAALERMARERGSALGLAGPLRPVTIERIAAWAKTLEDRGLVLAPVSALVAMEAKH